MFIGSGLFSAADANKDGALTRPELIGAFTKWFQDWDPEKTGSLNEEKLAGGFNATLTGPDFASQDRGFGGRGGQRGRGGARFGGGLRGGGIELDPLVAANESDKPLISKLLAVPSLRARYLGYVHDIAEKWLDWKTLGPLATRYQVLIADEVKADTRKLSSFDAFQTGVGGDAQGAGARGPERGGALKSFAEQRRAYLLNHPEVKKAVR